MGIMHKTRKALRRLRRKLRGKVDLRTKVKRYIGMTRMSTLSMLANPDGNSFEKVEFLFEYSGKLNMLSELGLLTGRRSQEYINECDDLLNKWVPYWG